MLSFASLLFVVCKVWTHEFLLDMSGTITPLLQDGHYGNNERCIFKFVAPSGYRMKFFFEKFDTGNLFDSI